MWEMLLQIHHEKINPNLHMIINLAMIFAVVVQIANYAAADYFAYHGKIFFLRYQFLYSSLKI